MSAYSDVLRAPSALAWLLVTLTSRLVVASVPLGSVLLAKRQMGSYAVGALLAGSCAAGKPWRPRSWGVGSVPVCSGTSSGSS
ncbi:hypothetical protein [Kytococcus sp. Marseille-QA3725]